MRSYIAVVTAALFAFTPRVSLAQAAGPKTLVAVLAHADDETNAAPVLARYAREGVQVYLLIATDGSQGTGFAAARGDTIQAGQGLANERAEEARCAAQALGAKPPILLSFPDGKLGDYIGDRTLGLRLTQGLAAELERLHPDAIVTWGPEGGTGHPDHRIVGDIVTQLARAGAPGVPERIFYMHIAAEEMRVMSPQRPPPLLLEPAARYLTVKVPFTPADFDAAMRSMACHKSQFSPEVVQRISAAAQRLWAGKIAFVPGFATPPASDLFR